MNWNRTEGVSLSIHLDLSAMWSPYYEDPIEPNHLSSDTE